MPRSVKKLFYRYRIVLTMHAVLDTPKRLQRAASSPACLQSISL